MNMWILKNAGIDYDAGVKRFLGRSNLYEKILSKFSDDNTFLKISSAYNSGDMEQLFAGLHEFKGMCGNIGLTSLYKASDTIVSMLRGGALPDAKKLDETYALLESEYHRILKAISDASEANI